MYTRPIDPQLVTLVITFCILHTSTCNVNSYILNFVKKDASLASVL